MEVKDRSKVGESIFRFAAQGNSLLLEGTPWPPVIRDDTPHDRSDLFKAIAEGLNNAPKYNFVVDKLREVNTAYEQGKQSASDVAKAVGNILKVLDRNP